MLLSSEWSPTAIDTFSLWTLVIAGANILTLPLLCVVVEALEVLGATTAARKAISPRTARRLTGHAGHSY